MEREPFPFYQVKRVFLACPGDLVSERSKFPKLLDTVNSLRAHSLGFHLEAVGWERVIPSFGRPQELINLELRIADLVVVLFGIGLVLRLRTIRRRLERLKNSSWLGNCLNRRRVRWFGSTSAHPQPRKMRSRYNEYSRFGDHSRRAKTCSLENILQSKIGRKCLDSIL